MGVTKTNNNQNPNEDATPDYNLEFLKGVDNKFQEMDQKFSELWLERGINVQSIKKQSEKIRQIV